MGNHKSTLKKNKIINNNTNTEGTQGLMTINSEKNIKKNITEEVIYKEKIKNKNMFSKRESVDILLTKNNLNTIPTENNEIIKQNNITIGNNVNNCNSSNKNMIEVNINEPNEKEYKISQNFSNSKEIGKNEKLKNEIKKTEFNNITIIDNLSNYFPKNVTKEEINEIVNMALNGYMVEEKSEYIQGQNLTKEQVESLVEIIYENITKNKSNNINYTSLDEIKVKIGMNDLNKENIEKMFFKGKNISQIQNDIIMKKLMKGRKSVKALFIELL